MIGATASVFGWCWWVPVVCASVAFGIYPLPFYPLTLLLFSAFSLLSFSSSLRRVSGENFLAKTVLIGAGYAGTGGADRRARVVRGGSWINNNHDNLRASYRNDNEPENRNNNLGFRCVLVGVAAGRCSTEMARCGPGMWPCPSVPRSHLTRITRPRRSRGKYAARAVAGRRETRKSRPVFFAP